MRLLARISGEAWVIGAMGAMVFAIFLMLLFASRNRFRHQEVRYGAWVKITGNPKQLTVEEFEQLPYSMTTRMIEDAYDVPPKENWRSAKRIENVTIVEGN